MRPRVVRRALAPIGIVVAATVLGFVFFAGPRSAPSNGTTNATLQSAVAPTSKESVAAGATLFAENCSTCHGLNAEGSALAPNLRGVGSATVDLWVSSGWMPLSVPTDEPARKPNKFTAQQTLELAEYIGTLYGGPQIPNVNISNSSVAEGFSLFSLNCAPCHTITGAGDALIAGTQAPPLHGLTPTQVAEAVETGPGYMPKFTPGALTQAQVLDVVAYVTTTIEHPSNPGGVGLGGVGPVAEGFIGLFLGVGACMLVALWIGDRTEDEEPENDEHGGTPAHA
jgi:ubiquinol-cytochrome c reductase cytochrome c subunit